MKMKTVDTNSNLLKRKKNGEYLIKVPKTDYLFWHPEELVSFSGKNNYLMTIQYRSDYYFNIIRNGKGIYNCDQVIDDRYIPASEWEQYFHQYNIN